MNSISFVQDAFGEFRAKDAMSNLQLNMELGMVGLEKYFDFVTPGIMKLWEYSKQIQVLLLKLNIFKKWEIYRMLTNLHTM